MSALPQNDTSSAIKFSLGVNRFDARPKQLEAQDFEAFKQVVQEHRSAVKGFTYISAAFSDGHRTKDTVELSRFLPFDFDGIPSEEHFTQLRTELMAWSGFGYTTSSHTPEAPRARAILEANRLMTREERIRVCMAVQQVIERKISGIKFDQSVYRGEQPVFTPMISSIDFEFLGEPIDVDAMLTDAPEIKTNGASTSKNLAQISSTDPVLRELFARSMVKRELGSGRYAVHCPCADEHSGPSESETATVYTLPKFNGFDFGNFTCLHDHCRERPQHMFLSALGLEHAQVRGEQSKIPDVDHSELIKNSKEKQESNAEQGESIGAMDLVIKPFDFDSDIYPRKLITINGSKSYAKGFLSVTGAAGGTGKSSLSIIEELSLAMGVDLFDKEKKPLRCGRQRVWSMSLEDDEAEHRRRVISAMRHYNISPEQIDGWYFVTYKNDSPVSVASINKMGSFVVSPQVEIIQLMIKEKGIDIINVDPFVNTHACPENDNVVMNKVADIWRSLAQRNEVAISLTHHIRKVGGGGEVTADDLRGAVSLISAARLVRVLSPMTQTEAANYGIDPGRARFYFWVNPTAKSNITPPAERRSWYHMASCHLGNETDLWEEDVLGVVERFEPPGALDGVTGEDVLKITARMIGADDAFLLKNCRVDSQSAGWIGNLIGEVIDINTKSPEGNQKIKEIIKAWIECKVLERVEVSDKKSTKRPCLTIGVAARTMGAGV
jgi:hypothetical protein